MKVGDLVRGKTKQYFDGVGLIVDLHDHYEHPLTQPLAEVCDIKTGIRTWMARERLEVINESR